MSTPDDDLPRVARLRPHMLMVACLSAILPLPFSGRGVYPLLGVIAGRPWMLFLAVLVVNALVILTRRIAGNTRYQTRQLFAFLVVAPVLGTAVFLIVSIVALLPFTGN